MNLKQMEVFVAVSENENFSKAANELFLSQPTVSAHISALEKELGVRLFDRNTKEVSLTEQGNRLYGYARQMLNIQNKIKETFSETRNDDNHFLPIASSSVPSLYLLPQILTTFQRKFPKEAFKVMETDSLNVVEQVLNGIARIGFVGTKLENKRCNFIPFYEDEMVVITPNTMKFRRQKEEMQESEYRDFSWIKNEPIILREEGSGTRIETERLLKKMGVDTEQLKIVAYMDHQETIKRMVRNKSGISVISKLAAMEDVAEKKILYVPLPKEVGKRKIYLVHKQESILSEAEKHLIETVQEIYQKENAE